jgi:hypothetical protein
MVIRRMLPTNTFVRANRPKSQNGKDEAFGHHLESNGSTSPA